MTAGHLVAYGDFSLLRDINTNRLVDARRQLVSVFSCEYTGFHNYSVLSVRNLEGGVSYLSGLLPEDSAEQTFLGGELCLSLRRHFPDQDISGANLCADPDNTSLVQILQGFLPDTRNVPGDFLRTELGVTGLALILLNMNRGIDIILYQPLAEQYGVLVVVTFPCHESDQRILSESKLSIGSGRAVGDNLSGFYMVTLKDNRTLIVAVALVASGKLHQVIDIPGSVVVIHADLIGGRAGNRSVLLRHHTDTGVYGGFLLDSGSYHRGLCKQKRNRLTLHVGSHQCAVCVVILQEGNQRGRHGEYHLRRHVHVLKHGLLVSLRLVSVTSGYIFMNKMSLCVQRLICLRYMVIILFIGRHVDNLFGYPRILRIAPVNDTVGCLDKPVLINSRVGCQRVNQTDVRAFRGLDGAHSSVMGVMDITDLKSRTVSGKSSGSKCGKTSLMRQLSKRIILVHKLGQLGRTEELLYRRGNRLDINQRLRRERVQILCGHALPDYSLQPGKTNPVLVLQKLSHAADPSVPQVIDVIIIADTVFQMHIIVNGGKNIFLCDVLRDQIVNVILYGILQILRIGIFLHKPGKLRIVHLLCHADFLRIDIHPFGDVHHQVGENLHHTVRRVQPYKRNRSILNLIRLFPGDCSSLLRDNFSRGSIYNVFRQSFSGDPAAKRQFFVEFISSDLGQIITAGIKKHSVNQTLRAVHGQRLSRTDLLVQFQKAFLIIRRCILGEARQYFRLLAEMFRYFRIRPQSEGAQKNGDRHFSGAVHTYPENIVGVSLVLQPRAPVGNNRTAVEFFSKLVMVNAVVNTRRTHQLADNNTLCAVNNKGAGGRHKREISHENLMLTDLVFFAVIEAHFNLQRSLVCCIPLFAFLYGILYIVLAQLEVHEFQAELSAIILNRRYVIKSLFQPVCEEPLIGIFLHLNQIGHLQNLFLSLVSHSYTSSAADRTYPVFLH